MNALRQLFGPSQQEIWTKLATELGAKFVDGTFWKGAKVQAEHGEWTITLDTYHVHSGHAVIPFTRLRAPYVNPDGFRFTIYRQGWFSALGKWLGVQDVEVGHADFDSAFIIQGTDEVKLRTLFADAELRRLISNQPVMHFFVTDDEGVFGPKFPPNTDELRLTCGGVVKDVERLKQFFELFAFTLDRLCHIGSAYENAPDLKL